MQSPGKPRESNMITTWKDKLISIPTMYCNDSYNISGNSLTHDMQNKDKLKPDMCILETKKCTMTTLFLKVERSSHILI